MATRRDFLIRGVGSTIGLAAGGLAWQTFAQEEAGALARNMITPATQEAIDGSLAYLANAQHADGAWGTNQHVGNVAVTALGGLALMSAGHQPGRGRYGNHVLRAVQNILSCEDPGQPGFLVSRRSQSHGPMYGHGFATLFLAS